MTTSDSLLTTRRLATIVGVATLALFAGCGDNDSAGSAGSDSAQADRLASALGSAVKCAESPTPVRVDTDRPKQVEALWVISCAEPRLGDAAVDSADVELRRFSSGAAAEATGGDGWKASCVTGNDGVKVEIRETEPRAGQKTLTATKREAVVQAVCTAAGAK